MGYIKKTMSINVSKDPMLDVNKFTGQRVTMLFFPEPLLVDKDCDKSLKITLGCNCFPWMELFKGTLKLIAFKENNLTGYQESFKANNDSGSNVKIPVSANWIGSSMSANKGYWTKDKNGFYRLGGLACSFTQASTITQANAYYSIIGSIEYYEKEPLSELSKNIINTLNEKLSNVIQYSIH